MGQINLKLSEKEYELIKYYAKQNKLQLASAFRTLINESLKDWKINFLINEYCSGRLGFKKAWILSELPFNEWILSLERSDCELNIPKTLENLSSAIALNINPKDYLKE